MQTRKLIEATIRIQIQLLHCISIRKDKREDISRPSEQMEQKGTQSVTGDAQ